MRTGALPHQPHRAVQPLVVFLSMGLFSWATPVQGQTQRISVAPDGGQANGASTTAAVSGDGRFVAYSSAASNLTANDSNSAVDAFVYDRVSGTATLVSLTDDDLPPEAALPPGQGGRDCSAEDISDDGRFVAFVSRAVNLVSVPPSFGCNRRNPAEACQHVYVRDRLLGTTERVSISSSGDLANRDAYRAQLSPDGRLVLFTSEATTLVRGDTNGVQDVFLHDRLTLQTTRVSVGNGGVEGLAAGFGGYRYTAPR